MTEFSNPCVFKAKCRSCNLCRSEDRPEMCIGLNCPDYTPCKKCEANRKLNEDLMCGLCVKLKERDITGELLAGKAVAGLDNGFTESEPNDEESLLDENLEENLFEVVDNLTRSERSKKRTGKHKKIKPIESTMPGTPPKEYSESETKYYESQWKEYSDFYRDPTVFPLIHNLIILEIELNFVTGKMIRTRSELRDEFSKRRTDIIRNIDILRRSLPSEEAMKMSEEEAALSIIHDRYIEEVTKRNNGKAKKIFDLPTIALAPVLHFKKDLIELLERLGYKTVDIFDMTTKIDDIPEDPQELAKMFGFPISQQFACEDDEDSVNYADYYDDDKLNNNKEGVL